MSGFVDVYYGYNSNQPIGRTTAFRNFDINSGQFGLNMIELVADKAPDATASRLGYHVALGFGQAMNIVNSTEPGQFPTESNFDQYLKEGYLEYLAPIGKGLQINVGKFVTPAGAEVIETKDNWNYSRGLLFALAIPYFHFGTSAKYAFNSKFALTGYLVNGWNNSIDNNSGKTTGFSAAWTPNSKFSLIQNYLVGSGTAQRQLELQAPFGHGGDVFAQQQAFASWRTMTTATITLPGRRILPCIGAALPDTSSTRPTTSGPSPLAANTSATTGARRPERRRN